MFDLFVLDVHVCPGTIDQLGRHVVGNTFVFAHGNYLIDQEIRVVVGKYVVDGRIAVLEQMDRSKSVV